MNHGTGGSRAKSGVHSTLGSTIRCTYPYSACYIRMDTHPPPSVICSLPPLKAPPVRACLCSSLKPKF